MQISKSEFDQMLLSVEKPGRYSGGEVGAVLTDPPNLDFRFAFCFPDTYEVGMSHLGMKILYGVLNSLKGVRCERAFMPWTDLREQLKIRKIPLFSIESKRPLNKFDMLGFTLQYELSYTNILDMLLLSNIPLYSCDRGENEPVIIAGGPCAYNPEPLANFIDIFVIGEGEEVTPELVELYRQCKKDGADKREFLIKAAQIPGIYVPALYDIRYGSDSLISSVTPQNGAPEAVTKRIIENLNDSYYPEKFVIPYIDTVHNRAQAEIFRGCIRGCRFCQAGYLYRPVREKSAETIDSQSRALCEATGYEELSLSSLSSSDYTEMPELLEKLLSWAAADKVALALPSLRIDGFSPELLEKINHLKKSGLTFAPEAGTQRLRDVINKNITEDDIFGTCKTAFEGGADTVKLYFMMGLPTETDEDIAGIANLSQKIVDLFYSLPKRKGGRGVRITVSVAVFVPKPHTPFQWFPQDSREEIDRKQNLLRSLIRSKRISLSWHDRETSFLEAVFARGDRRLGQALVKAVETGCILDGWDEFFSAEKWAEVFRETGIDPDFYARRPRGYTEILPWDHISCNIKKSFLINENENAKHAACTPNCREKCSGCGIKSKGSATALCGNVQSPKEGVS